MVREWEGGMTLQEIGRERHTDHKRVAQALRDRGCKIRRGVVGERHHAWKGGRKQRGEYVQVQIAPDSPYASMADQRGYVLEHRLVMAQHLGRPLVRGEEVHHVDSRRKSDNRIENLQLRRGQHGAGAAFVCADCGSHNVVAVPLAGR